jgi:magnesium-transporting ATPase (P-type)
MALAEFLGEVTLNEFILKVLFAILIIIGGVVLGKVIDLLLRSLSKTTGLDKHVRGSFVDLTLLIIRWSVYLIFLNMAIAELEIFTLTLFFSKILLAIPAFTAGLLILILGYALAFYLKKIIKSSETTGWEFVSQLVFFFVLLMFIIYSMKTALILFDEMVVNALIVIIVTISSAGVMYFFVKKELKKQHAE